MRTPRNAALVALFLLAGCAGGSRTTGPDDGGVDTTDTAAVAVATIDIEPFADEPADVRIEVEHDVPTPLMENTAATGVDVTMAGFRVQIFSTLDQEEAALSQDAAQQYWRRLVAQGRVPEWLPDELPVYRFFRQPYYRVRVGDFVERAVADTVAAIFVRRFEGSFVVPDQVTIRR